jgi:putative ABC transport system permease protein
MGASVMGATWELSRPFLRLALIGSLLAMPIAIWQMNDYLEGFYKRIDFPWWLLILTMVLAIAISMLSVIWQAYSVARSNPIISLKTE